LRFSGVLPAPLDLLDSLAVMQGFLFNSAAFLIALGAIVFVHEMGHFLAAKLFGVQVPVFSLGFGKRLWGFNYRGTDCRLSALPFGGYVRLDGEIPDERNDDPNAFLNKPRWQRIIVYLAGPAMNGVLSVALIAGVFMAGFEAQALQERPSVVGWIQDDGPAQAAGLKVGDQILTIDGHEVDQWKDVSFAFMTAAEKPVEVSVERAGERFTTTVTPIKVERYEYGDAGIGPELEVRITQVVKDRPAARAGFRSGDLPHTIDGQPVGGWKGFVAHIESHPGVAVNVGVLRNDQLVQVIVTPEADEEGLGKIGVYGGIFRKLPLGEAIVASARFNVEIIQRSVQILGKLLTNDIKAKSALSGPVEIAVLSGEAAKRGIRDLLFTMGFLSISIGFMNLLPIPVLDGGHISLLLVESVLRRDLSIRFKERVSQLGFMMLMTLMAVVIFFDLTKILS